MWSIRGGMFCGWLLQCFSGCWLGVLTSGPMRPGVMIARWPRPPRRTPLRIVPALTRNGPPLSSGWRCRLVLLLTSTS